MSSKEIKNLNKISSNQRLCDLNNKIFDVMGTGTRRELLRLISCENNYGNQLAKILNVSNPTIHRHLQKLVDSDILQEMDRTSESFSGYKGGEAILFNITKGVFLNLSILPHLIHAHVIETNETGAIVEPTTPREVQFKPNTNSKTSRIKKYTKLSEQSQLLNQQIIELEKQLVQKLLEKNATMENLDNLLAEGELNFASRIILRAIACLGPGCYDDIANILGEDPLVIDHKLQNLSVNGWLQPIESE